MELLAGVIAGAVVTFIHGRDAGRPDEQLLGLVAFAVFGVALLTIPVGALRGRRRRRRWIEAVVLQGTLVFIFFLALVTSKRLAAAVWPFLVAVAILTLLLVTPARDEDFAGPT